MKKVKAKARAARTKVSLKRHAEVEEKVEEVGIQQRPGDSDGGDYPCMYCLRNPSRHELEYFDIKSGRYVCDMCAGSRYGKALSA